MENESEILKENYDANDSAISFSSFHKNYVHLFNKYFPLIRISRNNLNINHT